MQMRELKIDEIGFVTGGCDLGPVAMANMTDEEIAEVCAELAGQPSGTFTVRAISSGTTGNRTEATRIPR